MILKILGCGTSTGVPIPGCDCAVCTSDNPRNQRSRTSALIKANESFNILIDASVDLRYQALRWKVRHLEAVLFTHAHVDHILGIDDLRGFNFVQRCRIPCYASSETLRQIKHYFGYIFEPDPTYEGGMVPQLAMHEIESYKPFAVGPVTVQPFNLKHGKLDVTGFRVGDLAYATDCNSIPETSMDVIKGVRYLVLDGLRYEPHRTHFTIPQAIEMAQLIGAEKTYLIHMTHSIDYDQVNADLPRGIELAYDGLEINFSE